MNKAKYELVITKRIEINQETVWDYSTIKPCLLLKQALVENSDGQLLVNQRSHNQQVSLQLDSIALGNDRDGQIHSIERDFGRRGLWYEPDNLVDVQQSEFLVISVDAEAQSRNHAALISHSPVNSVTKPTNQVDKRKAKNDSKRNSNDKKNNRLGTVKNDMKSTRIQKNIPKKIKQVKNAKQSSGKRVSRQFNANQDKVSDQDSPQYDDQDAEKLHDSNQDGDIGDSGRMLPDSTELISQSKAQEDFKKLKEQFDKIQKEYTKMRKLAKSRK